MNKDEIIKKTEEFVRSKLEGESTGHDWFHTDRVRKLSIILGKEENADLFIVEMSALLHDVYDWKFNEYMDIKKEVYDFLHNLGLEINKIENIINIILNISFKGAGEENKINTKEGMVVQDADRLDALGAIGIARAFAYGGYKKREIYNPEIKPIFHKTFEEYKNSKGTTINHFYEKLLLLKDRMNTEAGRRIAEERHNFMEKFLEEFYNEWDGKK